MQQGQGTGGVWRCVAAALALAWPLWFLAQSLVHGLPAMATSLLSDWTIASSMLRPDGWMARVFPPGAATADYRPGMSEAVRDPWGLSLVLGGVLGVLLLRWAGRSRLCWHPALLAAAWIGMALLQVPLRSLWFRRESIDMVAVGSALVGVPLAFIALRMLSRRTSLQSLAARASMTFVQVGLPAALLPWLWGRGWGWEAPAATAAVAGVLCVLAALRVESSAVNVAAPGRRWMGIGAVASLCVFLLGSAATPQRPVAATLPASATVSLPANAPYEMRFFQRGVSFTSEWPASYHSAEAHEMLRKLRADGVDAIALVPYGVTMPGSGSLRFGGWERDESLLALANTAHSLGMRVMLKPQVWIRGSYPGDFDLPDEAERDAWLAQYETFALHYAELAVTLHADLFCIGTEFAKLTRHEAYWRRLIGRIRQVYPGPLTYAANFGQEFETLAFWDELDYIGLNNYYPLPDNLDVSPQVARVEAVQARFGKPVIFTEAGYSSYENGHRKPWSEEEGPVDLELQARAYEAVLAAYWDKPWFHGAYWWKVGSNAFGGPRDRSHTPWGKPAMGVLRRWYAKPANR